MRKKWIVFVLMLGLLWIPTSRDANAYGRKWTVMVYMCGSNLESSYGAATDDLREMMSAAFPVDQVSLLVMAGGSSRWNLGFDASETTILEVRPGRQRSVWRSEQLNMGDPETLIQLIKFGREKYPADHYGLILWDHGGGPLEGVCLDETHMMDRLSLSELAQALKKALGISLQLDWIGFDACLMGTAEVAQAMVPYAKYMVASQETEPATGWNYSFLETLAEDQNGGDTGRRIVDAYFEGKEESTEFLTMACVDLSGIDAVITAMDGLFQSKERQIDEKTFPDYSLIRNAVESFGQVHRSDNEDGYDLVDLGDLVSCYGEEAAPLKSALEKAVILSRSNLQNTSGLSVYHPYLNKIRYLEAWRENYRRLDFSLGYAKYIERFGELLTGKEVTDWRGLRTVHHGMDDDGKNTFSLQLTPEQQVDFVSARMMVMAETESEYGEMPLTPIYVENVKMDPNGMLRGSYQGRSLYAVDDGGNILSEPICYLPSKDGEYYMIPVDYQDFSGGYSVKKEASVHYDAVLNPETNDLDIVRTYVYDPATESYTNRIPYSEEGYTQAWFFYFIRNFPGENLEIRDYNHWELNSSYFRASTVDLDTPWHFHFVDQWSADDLYAMFEITDSRQNTYSSIPVPLNNPENTAVTVSADMTETEGLSFHFSARRKENRKSPEIVITMVSENRTGQPLNIKSDFLILNGTQMANTIFLHHHFTDDRPDVETFTVHLSGNDLRGLEVLSCIDFELEIAPVKNRSNSIQIPVHLELQNCPLDGIAPEIPEVLAEDAKDGITWQLLSLEQDQYGDFNGILHILNDTEEIVDSDLDIGINDTVLYTHFSPSLELFPHTELYLSFMAENGAGITGGYGLVITDGSTFSGIGMEQAVEQAGDSFAEQVVLWLDMNQVTGKLRDQVILPLKDPLPLQEKKPVPEGVTLLEGSLSMTMESVVVGDNGIGLGLRLRNDSDETVWLRMRKAAVNGTPIENDPLDEHYVIPPHTRMIKGVQIYDKDLIKAGDPAEEVQFRLYMGNDESTPVVLRFPKNTVFGVSGGTVLEGKQLSVTEAVFIPKQMALSEEIELPAGEVRPVRLSPPLNESEMKRIIFCSADICTLDTEKDNMLIRPVLSGDLTPDEQGQWAEVFCGLTVKAGEVLLGTRNMRKSENQWLLNSNPVSFYRDRESYDSPDPSLSRGTDGSAKIHVEIREGKPVLISQSVEMRNLYSDVRWNRFEDRTNYPLEEIGLAVVDCTTYESLDWSAERVLKREQFEFLPLGESISFSLIPLESLGSPLCIRYRVKLEDKSLIYLLTDYETGRLLKREKYRQ